jgi:hypothetical protein
MKNNAIRDALYQTDSGKSIAIEAKKHARSRRIAKRIREVKSLFYSAFVKTAENPKDFSWRKSVYNDLKPNIRKLGIHGGEEYNHVMTALKYLDFKDAVSRLEKV